MYLKMEVISFIFMYRPTDLFLEVDIFSFIAILIHLYRDGGSSRIVVIFITAIKLQFYFEFWPVYFLPNLLFFYITTSPSL